MPVILQLVIFTAFVLLLLAVDLGVFHRKAHSVGVREAGLWSVFWISLSLAFAGGVFIFGGTDSGVDFLTAYAIEKSLSVDNIFVFVIIFSFFAVPAQSQHRVLFYGIIGALIMRAVFIAAGISLLEAFHWVIFPFGAFLIITGLRLLTHKEAKIRPERNIAVRLIRRVLPVTPDYVGNRFVVRQAGRLMMTPLCLALIVVETTDLIFAVDSIPAVIAVTRDPFIVYTSNILAILGLRSLYFLLAGVIGNFRYLSVGLAMVLTFIGVKMILSETYEISSLIALVAVGGILSVSIVASLVVSWKEKMATTDN